MDIQKKLAPTPIPLGEDLKAYLKHKAIDNARPLGKEIIARLEESRLRDEKNELAPLSGQQVAVVVGV